MNSSKNLKLFSKTWLLLGQIFVVSTCSLIYELLVGTTTTNITSNSVLAFSLAIGLFLAGLGSGALFSSLVTDRQLVQIFIMTESFLALIGGFSVIILYASLVFSPYFNLVQVILTLVIGFLSGLEIPILTRILGNFQDFQLRSILAKVLSFDYLGGLAASLLFPLLLLPYFGLVRLGFLTGIINGLMALLALGIFWPQLQRRTVHVILIGATLLALITGAIWSSSIYNFLESQLYRDPIIYSTQTPYQRLVLTKKASDLRLFLNGGVQFSSLDEYRYHESLVMPAMIQLLSSFQPQSDLEKLSNSDLVDNGKPKFMENKSSHSSLSLASSASSGWSQNSNTNFSNYPKNSPQLEIAIFGGGDGLGIRQLLKFESYIKQIYLVDIDRQVTDLARSTTLLTDLNGDSLNHPKVQVINADAWGWIQTQPKVSLDLVINDFPDPDDNSIAKLYSQEFYHFIDQKLRPGGLLVTQSSSPYTTPKAFWSINQTLGSVFPKVLPYVAYVPSFGLWGFQMAGKNPDFGLENINSFMELSSAKSISEPGSQISANSSSTNYFISVQNPGSISDDSENLYRNLNSVLTNNQFVNQDILSKLFVLEKDVLSPRLKNGELIDLSTLKINTLDNLILTTYYTQSGLEAN